MGGDQEKPSSRGYDYLHPALPLMESVSYLPLSGTQSETLTHGHLPCKYKWLL